ncbi:protein of unknown function [Pseudorhizobium banfieldiae]|uniref:Uncharacterized protein n=1 Tax=Pseudorhizobium banfieldiae TaxID=1125847 RepID=L0NGJ9_9HYPH|nr:protein of unknown function [Pseudorhizobium banfieldiae]
MRQCPVQLLCLHRVEFERNEVEGGARASLKLPLPPRLAEVQPRAEAEFADSEIAAGLPSIRQSVAGEKDVAAFEPTVAAAIKVVAKLGGKGHIALVPLKALVTIFGNVVAHGQCR